MRRILITHWVGDAWERLTTHPDYHDTFKRCCETTGALITANGSRDELINALKGMTTYKVPNDVPHRRRAKLYCRRMSRMMKISPMMMKIQET